MQDASWRANCVRLACERNLAGQAFYETRGTVATLRVVCANDQKDHAVGYDGRDHEVWCDCRAGELGWPCAHAGAVLLLVADPPLAVERARDPEGRERKKDGRG